MTKPYLRVDFAVKQEPICACPASSDMHGEVRQAYAAHHISEQRIEAQSC